MLKNSPEGGVYSDPAYLAALCEATDARFRILGLFRGDLLEGGVALYERTSSLGCYVAPRLLLYYCGPVLARPQSKYPSERTARQVDALSQLATHVGRMGYGSVIMKSPPSLSDVRPFLAQGWKSSPAYTYVVPLADLPAQWERVEQNLRRLVKRCTERDQLVFAADNDFASFIRLHEITLSRKGAASYLPRERFAAFFRRIEADGLAKIFHARLPDGTPIATQLVLMGPYSATYTVCAGGDPEYAKLGAQAFLRWRTFEYLGALGYTSNDLTDAALNSITHFKSQLGGDLGMSHVLQAPLSTRFALGAGTSAVVGRGAGIARKLVRRIAVSPKR